MSATFYIQGDEVIHRTTIEDTEIDIRRVLPLDEITSVAFSYTQGEFYVPGSGHQIIPDRVRITINTNSRSESAVFDYIRGYEFYDQLRDVIEARKTPS